MRCGENEVCAKWQRRTIHNACRLFAPQEHRLPHTFNGSTEACWFGDLRAQQGRAVMIGVPLPATYSKPSLADMSCAVATVVSMPVTTRPRWLRMVARLSLNPLLKVISLLNKKTLSWILTEFPRNRRYFPQLTSKLLYINSLLESDHIFWKRTSSPKVERHLHYTNTLFRMLTQTAVAVQKPLFHCANVISCKLT